MTEFHTEPYNMTQAQRDAAHIAALEKQLQDMTAVIKALAVQRTHVDIRVSMLDMESTADQKEMFKHLERQAAFAAVDQITRELSDRGDLYRKLAQYEQWFYAKANYTTRLDALRSTMTTCR